MIKQYTSCYYNESIKTAQDNSQVKGCINIYISGPDIFYTDRMEDMEVKLKKLTEILAAHHYKVNCILPAGKDLLDDDSLIHYWQLTKEGKKLSDEAIAKFEYINRKIADDNREIINNICANNNELGIVLANIEPYPFHPEYAINTDPGTSYETGYAEGLGVTKFNIFVVNYYNSPAGYLHDRLADMYGGIINTELVPKVGLVIDNKNFNIQATYQVDNLMCVYLGSINKNLRSIGLSFKDDYCNSFDEAIDRIVTISDAFFSNQK